MINEKLYNKTVDILVQAYFEDTLRYGNCAACAVGNIVAANLGYSFLTEDKKLNWKESPAYVDGQAINWYMPVCLNKKPNSSQMLEIKSTGYSIVELKLIEEAFESGSYIFNEKYDDPFNGLIAAIEVLDIIHENTDHTLTATTKQRFVKC